VDVHNIDAQKDDGLTIYHRRRGARCPVEDRGNGFTCKVRSVESNERSGWFVDAKCDGKDERYFVYPMMRDRLGV
jgi:hypothetical protein